MKQNGLKPGQRVQVNAMGLRKYERGEVTEFQREQQLMLVRIRLDRFGDYLYPADCLVREDLSSLQV